MVEHNDAAGQALAVIEGRALAVPDIRDVEHKLAAVDAFKKAVHERLIEDTDYGTIPGTPKPTLYQPGAQKVCELMQLRPRFDPVRIVEDWDRPLFHYVYRCVLVHIPSGYEVSECIGSCNSMESKYRWRYMDKRCPACGEEAIRKSNPQYGDGWYCNRKAGGCGANFNKGDPAIENQPAGKVSNDDIFSQLNTLDKMAQKRSMVGASLFIGRLSDVFTQDLEDMETRSIPTDERTVDAPASQPAQQGRSSGRASQGGGQSQQGGNGAGPARGSRCEIHKRPWGKHPETGVMAHPTGDGEWCIYGEGFENSDEAPPARNAPGATMPALVANMRGKLEEDEVKWDTFIAFLKVETWDIWESLFGGEGVPERERVTAAVKAAWARYENDKKYRSSGCKECRQPANVLGSLLCSDCESKHFSAGSTEAEQTTNAPSDEGDEGDDRPMYDADGNEINPPLAPDPADFETEGDETDDLPF